MSIRSPMTKEKVGTRSSPVEKNTQEERIFFTGMNITLPSPTFDDFYLIYRSMSIAKINAADALKTFTQKCPLPNMSVFEPARTLCRCCTCFRLQKPSRRTLNSNNFATRTRLRLSYMRTLNQFSSQFSVKTKTLFTISITKSQRGARSWSPLLRQCSNKLGIRLMKMRSASVSTL